MPDEKKDQTILGVSLDEEKKEESEDKAPASFLSRFQEEGKTLDEIAEALAKKAVHADSMIRTLKDENAELRNDTQLLKERQLTAEEIIAKIKSDEGKQDMDNVYRDSDSSSGLTPEQIDAILEKKLSERATSEQKEANAKASWTKLAETCEGSMDKAKKLVSAYIQENPSRKELLAEVGQTDPESFVRLINAQGMGERMSPDRDTFHTGTTTKLPPGLTYEEAKRIRKENPSKYMSTQFQRELVQQVTRYKDLGLDFYGKN